MIKTLLKPSLILSVLLLSSSALAKIQPMGKNFEGIVSAIAAKQVTVVHLGKLWNVPRKSIVQQKDIKIGQVVEVVLSSRDLSSVKVETPKPYKVLKK